MFSKKKNKEYEFYISNISRTEYRYIVLFYVDLYTKDPIEYIK